MEIDHTPLPRRPMSGEQHRQLMKALDNDKARLGAARQRRNALLDAMEHVSVKTLPHVRKDMEEARADVYFWQGRVERWGYLLREFPMM